MYLDELKEMYPIHDTLIGFYSMDHLLTAEMPLQIESVEKWIKNLFYRENTWMPFVYYHNKKFEGWGFGFSRVCGYFIDEHNNCKLVTYEPDFGYELTDPQDTDQIIITPDEYDCEKYNYDWDKMTSLEAVSEHVARKFNENAYSEGRIFTKPEQLINFIKKMKENS